MYMGPSIPKLGIRRHLLILGSEPPPQLLSLIETKPMLRSLVVPSFKVAEAAEKVNTRGSLEWLAAQEVLKYNRERAERERKVTKPNEERK